MRLPTFIVIRLLQSILIIWIVVSIVFVTSRVIGKPENALLPIDATNEQLEEMRRFLGVGRPILDQYGDFVGRAFQLDFGYSYVRRKPALDLVTARLWTTAKLGLAGLVFALAVGVPLGVLSALRRRSASVWLARLLVLIGQGFPSFWLGLMLIFFFSVELGWFPTGGAEGIKALILPAFTLGLVTAAPMMRITRAAVIEVMGTDYIRTARAKGLAERTVLWRHGMRNAVLPLVTVLGIEIGRLIGGSVIVEIVFSWPGVGRLIFQAIENFDYPVIEAGIVVIAASIVLANFFVDIAYVAIDPRIRRESV